MFSQLWQHRSKSFEPHIFFVSKAIGTPLDDTNLVVESLDKSQRHFVLRPAVSGNAIPMTLDHLCKFFIGSKPLPFERRLPVLKKAPGPTFALIAPQLTERFLEQICAVQPLVSTQQSLQRLAAFKCKIVPARQQRVLLPLDVASIFTHQTPVSLFLT